MPETSGVVLAGGVSRRFGRDKRSALVDGVPLLQRAVAVVAAACDDVAVVTHPQRPIPDDVVLPGHVEVLVDDGRGPLAGLIAGLDHARHDRVAVLGGDHPWAAPTTLIAALDRLADRDHLDAVIADDGRAQPLVGAYRRHVATIAARRLDAGDPRLVELLSHLVVDRATDLPELARSVADVDRPADLAAPTPGGEGRP